MAAHNFEHVKVGDKVVLWEHTALMGRTPTVFEVTEVSPKMFTANYRTWQIVARKSDGKIRKDGRTLAPLDKEVRQAQHKLETLNLERKLRNDISNALPRLRLSKLQRIADIISED